MMHDFVQWFVRGLAVGLGFTLGAAIVTALLGAVSRGRAPKA